MNKLPENELKGRIFDIQHYAIYDGPGIRTTVFFKGCPLRCAWCHNPESQAAERQMSYFAEKCAACGSCIKACKNEAVSKKGRGIARDESKCVVCGLCAEVCEARAVEVIGREATVAEIADVVERDRPFYEESEGGGATLSGGEAAMQPEFMFALLEDLKARGIHTAVETCGFFNEKLIPRLVKAADLILFDIKHTDSARHEKFTGVPLKVIEKNFAKLIEMAGEGAVVARVPLIPGVNTDEESVAALAAFLKKHGYKGEAHLMPYNRMASTKWLKIGRGHEYRDFGVLEEEDIARISETLQRAGYKVFVNR